MADSGNPRKRRRSLGKKVEDGLALVQYLNNEKLRQHSCAGKKFLVEKEVCWCSFNSFEEAFRIFTHGKLKHHKVFAAPVALVKNSVEGGEGMWLLAYEKTSTVFVDWIRNIKLTSSPGDVYLIDDVRHIIRDGLQAIGYLWETNGYHGHMDRQDSFMIRHGRLRLRFAEFYCDEYKDEDVTKLQRHDMSCFERLLRNLEMQLHGPARSEFKHFLSYFPITDDKWFQGPSHYLKVWVCT